MNPTLLLLLLLLVAPVAHGHFRLFVRLILPTLVTDPGSDPDAALHSSGSSCGNLGTAPVEVLHRLTGTINKHLIPFEKQPRAQQASA